MCISVTSAYLIKSATLHVSDAVRYSSVYFCFKGRLIKLQKYWF